MIKNQCLRNQQFRSLLRYEKNFLSKHWANASNYSFAQWNISIFFLALLKLAHTLYCTRAHLVIINSFTCTFLTHALPVLRSDRNYEKNEQWTGNTNPQTSQWSTLQIWRFGLLKSYSPTVSFPLHPLLCIHVWKGHQIFNPRHLFWSLVFSFVLSSRQNCKLLFACTVPLSSPRTQLHWNFWKIGIIGRLQGPCQLETKSYLLGHRESRARLVTRSCHLPRLCYIYDPNSQGHLDFVKSKR